MAAESQVASVAAPPVEDERVATAASAGEPDPVAVAAEAAGDRVLRVAAHPRAARRVAESKAWGGLAGFAVGGYLSLAHDTLADAALRALVTGVVCYVAVWAAAVFVWRRLVVAELREREHALLSGVLARREAAAGEAPGGAAPLPPDAAQ